MKIRLLLVVTILIQYGCNGEKKKTSLVENRLPEIFPDYTSLVIPVNIAPLNFMIREEAKEFSAFFSGPESQGFRVNSKNGKILIPIRKWKKLLMENIGDSIQIDISAKKAKQWIAYRSFKNYVSPDSLDSYLVYRKINSALILWNDMAIMQRSTETFEESAILENKNTDGNCMHCHTFQHHNPENFLLHLRTPPGGTYIRSGGKERWLETKTPFTMASFAYPAWHPAKNLIAFSTNIIHQVMYASGERLNYVYDENSDIIVYDIDKNLVFTSPKIAGNDLENLPNWSADGKYLYFISCPSERKEIQGVLTQYDLMRISFDPENHKWGHAETILSADSTGLSITFPEVSPDGRYIVFCMADYGYFTIGNTSSDLYIMDLETGDYRKLRINSRHTESFHNWSMNSCWLVFASKREDGINTLPYFSHIDSAGNESKAFVLPSKDPESLLTRLFNYNRPVFVHGKIQFKQQDILSVISRQTEKVIFDTVHVAVDSLPSYHKSNDRNESSIYEKK